MKKEDIQAALEAIGKGGIQVAGDLVLEKHVEYEVANVEEGGVGIQVINGNAPKVTNPKTQREKKNAEEKGNSNSCAMENAKNNPLARFGVPMFLDYESGGRR